ncbi:MAG: YggS family pyridoxal phosphate-dependent enzyme [Nocardioidaceae bacterium]
MTEPSRRVELAGRLAEVRQRIVSSAFEAGRSPAGVTLVVVTKTWPSSDVRLLHELGVHDFGENRHPEAERKAADVADLELTWHFIGQVQSNKAARIAGYADVVQSVDSPRVVQRLNAGANASRRLVDCMVQVNLDRTGAATGRGGVRPDEVEDVAREIVAADRLRLVGVMGVGPPGQDATAAYLQLADVRGRVARMAPEAGAMSAGMSADFCEAIAAGATHVRVGSAVLGERPPLR